MFPAKERAQPSAGPAASRRAPTAGIYNQQNGHNSVTLPKGVMKDVFSRRSPDELFHLLADAEEPLQYTEARDALGHHPQEFKRALSALEKWGLVQVRAVPREERPDDRRRVRLELTALGWAAVRLHARIDQAWKEIAQDEGIDEDALLAA